MGMERHDEDEGQNQDQGDDDSIGQDCGRVGSWNHPRPGPLQFQLFFQLYQCLLRRVSRSNTLKLLHNELHTKPVVAGV
jgi:hypothetical protein